MRRLALACFLTLFAWNAHSQPYPCPSDPGFCYVDVGNDGCFDTGTDTGPIDDMLEAGTFAAAGSIVCPPSVASLKSAERVDWSTSAGGSVLFYGTQLQAQTVLEVSSDDRILLGGRVKPRSEVLQGRPRSFALFHAVGDIDVRDKIATKTSILLESDTGSITVADDLKLRASLSIRLLARAFPGTGRRITLGDRVALKADIIEVVGEFIELSNPRMSAFDRAIVVGDDIVLHGLGKMVARSARDGETVLNGTRTTVDSVRMTARQDATVRGGESLVIGKSRLRASGSFSGQPTGDAVIIGDQIDADEVDLFGKIRNLVGGGAGPIVVTNSTLKGGTAEILVDPGASCDLSGTLLKSAVIVNECD